MPRLIKIGAYAFSTSTMAGGKAPQGAGVHMWVQHETGENTCSQNLPHMIDEFMWIMRMYKLRFPWV